MDERVLPLDPPPRLIAVFRALFLGDLLCSIPAFRALRCAYPQAEITLIGLPWAREFVERTPYLDRLEVFPGYSGIMEVPYEADRTEAFFAAARSAPYDLAIQMHGNGHISNGFVAGLGARVSLGYRNGPDDRLSRSLLYWPDEHEIRRWLRLVGTLAIPANDTRVDFPLTRAEQRHAAALLAAAPDLPGPLVGLHTGAKDAPRRWPAERFAALGDALAKNYGARIVLTGSAAEREITSAVRRAMQNPTLDLAGETSLGTFAAVLQRLDLLVTNDTGASHLAAATRTPSVVLFGPSRPEQWAPLDQDRHRPIDALRLEPSGADPETALRQLPVAPVFDACADLLTPPTSQRRAATSRRRATDGRREPSIARRSPLVVRHPPKES